ncbi:enoyl-CoA hydratase/isomerase family protein [Gordonia hongkongensis]|uniref:Enoyl-CoA hydratase/isomerase family protein n=1 Tax=Gordonia hongkongensis TaxID=1701090 RepID=A0AAX3T7X9_9ACTN|nr:enoyl-CoA hydratase/isomerase family protein [Gordonia hongkongensis]WFP25107.1 enoyl-CoA hydratase/isomerase family protein [Gordonia hongkongensis]
MPAVLVERDGEITTLTLYRPDALNTLNADLVRDLTVALDEVDEDTGCRVVILTGAGRAFCAGLT